MTTSDRTSAILTTALFAPILLLVVVLAMTWRAERRVAVVTDRVVHDYAALAAWQYARRANMAVHDEVMRVFGPAPGGHQRTRGSSTSLTPAILLSNARTSDGLMSRPEFAFTYDPVNGTLTTAPDGVNAATIRPLILRIDTLIAGRQTGDEPHQLLFEDVSGRLRAFALWLAPRGENVPPFVNGVVADGRVLDSLFLRTLRDEELLPSTVRRTESPGTGLALRLTAPGGAVVAESPQRLGATRAIDSTGFQGGTLRVELDIPEAHAEQLLIGGAPTSQLPALSLMLVVAAVLATVGITHYRRARALAATRARFVTNVSHELRTPLAQISMFAETLHLGRERNTMERQQFAGIILAEARRLATLVENVMRVSPAVGTHQMTPLPSEVRELIQRAATAFAPIAAAAGVPVSVDAPDHLAVQADGAAFQQIMLNLLDNAVKHGGGSRVSVTATSADDQVTITVEDEGPGIPQEWRSRVFEPFAQIAGRKGTGAGLGLSIVRDLVTAQGGTVTIGDSPAGGARVSLVLPRATAPASTLSAAAGR